MNGSSYQVFDVIQVKVNRDVDILGRVNSRSHFRHVAGKQISVELSFADLRRCRLRRCVR